MITTVSYTDLSATDQKIIFDIVQSYPRAPLFFLTKQLLKIYGLQVSSLHYITLGYYLGMTETEKYLFNSKGLN